MNNINTNLSSITTGPRQSNFELLRIIAMFLVLVVHADFWTFGSPTASEFTTNPLNAFTRTLLESISIVCVNVFILISGWFGIRPTLKGLMNFVFQCAFFLFGIYMIMVASGFVLLTPRGIAGCLCLTNANWFIRAYVGLYILAPVLNSFIEKASKRRMQIFLIAFYLFQTIWGWSGAARFVEDGYSTFSFIGLYVLARYVRKYISKRITCYGSACYILCVLAITLQYYLSRKLGLPGSAYAYVNPLVIIASVGLVAWFSQLKMKVSNTINWIVRSAFGVFLIHTNPNIGEPIYKVAINHIYNTYSGVKCLLVIFILLVGIYIAGIIFDQPRKWLWNRIAPLLFKNK